ncbi:MAG TPA: hypothetical protein VEY95_02350 [Azospirillaceae bacterium]|nr:hypothetical protein [Azospirillaceae bacterium]
MPHRNRVTPFNELVAVPDRGLFLGNRGCLHDASGTIRRRWAGRAWICCLTRFKDRRRALMQPGRYTELFFLDEATALAAGHRPCAECRRDRYDAFRAAWARAHPVAHPVDGSGKGWRAPSIDRVLHAARTAQGRWTADPARLPDGAMIVRPDDPNAWLVLGGRLLRWSPSGYDMAVARPHGPVDVLTPEPLVAVLREGYSPHLHPSAAQV